MSPSIAVRVALRNPGNVQIPPNQAKIRNIGGNIRGKPASTTSTSHYRSQGSTPLFGESNPTYRRGLPPVRLRHFLRKVSRPREPTPASVGGGLPLVQSGGGSHWWPALGGAPINGEPGSRPIGRTQATFRPALYLIPAGRSSLPQVQQHHQQQTAPRARF
jgi:hypothetical protein